MICPRTTPNSLASSSPLAEAPLSCACADCSCCESSRTLSSRALARASSSLCSFWSVVADVSACEAIASAAALDASAAARSPRACACSARTCSRSLCKAAFCLWSSCWLASKSSLNRCLSCLYVATSITFSRRSACARCGSCCASLSKKLASLDNRVCASGCSTSCGRLGLVGSGRVGSGRVRPSVKRWATVEALWQRASSSLMTSAATADGISTSRPTPRSSWCVLVVAVPWKLPIRRMVPGSSAGNCITCVKADHRSSSSSGWASARSASEPAGQGTSSTA
mmetsp:Transcript_85196/g.275861  ORF Transcript_85196/g.275861 Transcript_85196/m.275861 type:complete len:283 (+) Transcript_85196:784-1632(+)